MVARVYKTYNVIAAGCRSSWGILVFTHADWRRNCTGTVNEAVKIVRLIVEILADFCALRMRLAKIFLRFASGYRVAYNFARVLARRKLYGYELRARECFHASASIARKNISQYYGRYSGLREGKYYNRARDFATTLIMRINIYARIISRAGVDYENKCRESKKHIYARGRSDNRGM